MLMLAKDGTSTSALAAVDVAELAVFEGLIQQVAAEMDATFERCAFSPVISEAIDRASGLYDATHGGVIAQGRTGLPIFVGTMQSTVAGFLSMGRELRDGDVYIMNDPYLGGTHLMDVRLLSPYYFNDELICILANCGHWADIGGAVAGGFGPAAQSIHEEGLRIRPARIYADGRIIEDVKQIILDNIRIPQDREGDLLAQLSGLEVGRRRMHDVLSRYGVAEFRRLASGLIDYSDRVMRAHLLRVPDGRYEARGLLDDDGVNWDPVEIRCTLEVHGDEAVVDMHGTSERSAGPLNAPRGAAEAAVKIALLHLFSDIPINHGSFRAIQIVIPDGCVLDARYPTAVAGCPAEVATRVIDCVLAAFGETRTDLAQGAPFSTSANITLHGVGDEGEYIMYYFGGGGYGGHAEDDGLSNACPAGSMARTEPVEVLEERYPLRFNYFRLRDGSGGPGEFRGGLGVDYEFRFTGAHAHLSLLMDRGKFGPPGVHGGGEGAKTEVVVRRTSGDAYIPPHLTKDQHVLLESGDCVRVATPGGGGYGDPDRRDAERVARDQRAGYA